MAFGECSNIQVINEGSDPTLDEQGFVTLVPGQSVVSVQFATPKASDQYRFEYLYIDAFGVVNPGAIEPVVQFQTLYGFTVDLAGVPIIPGYVLRWRVVVVDLTIINPNIDAPESFRVMLPYILGMLPIPPVPPQFSILTVTFQNPRSNTSYGFSELRIENLIDDPVVQAPIVFQVCAKTLTNFTIVFNPTPPTQNYFLVGRTP